MRNSNAVITHTVHRQIEAEKVIALIGKKYLKELLKNLKPLAGKKIYKVDGGQVKAFADVTSKLREKFTTSNQRIWISRGFGSLTVEFNFYVSFGIYENDGMAYGAYYKMYVYAGKLDNNLQVLEELYDYDKVIEPLNNALKVRWKKVQDVREKIVALQQKSIALNDTIPYYARIR